ncbi:MAG: CMP-binding protein [Planctomycetaceae bacterium]|nr:CMP-binding protein [Planctomycetaceae bacterium]
MARQFVNELRDGDAIEEVYFLADKQLRANRNANLYLLAQLRDKSGQISGLMWNVNEDMVAGFNSGDFVKIRGKVHVHQGNLQVIVTHIHKHPADTVDLALFEEAPSEDVERLMTKLRDILLSIEDPSIRTLMECFLIDEELMRDLTIAAAGVKAHHAYRGGLVEHIVNMLETAQQIDHLYPDVDNNLLLAGIFLHDIGKVREMSFENSFVYTDEGQLLGHMCIGVEMVTEKVAEVERLTGEPFPRETALRIKHMIISHHGTYEFGSARLPMTPEAIALHHLDNLDAKVHEFSRTIDNDPNKDSHWTPFITRIDRKLFKGQRKD